MTFPLPLSPFEYYSLASDYSTYPFTFFARFRFQGRLEPSKLQEALGVAVGRHPLLHATLRQSGVHALEWVDAAQPQPQIEWHQHHFDTFRLTDAHFRLDTEPGMRLRVFPSQSETNMLLQVHHCCCDGIGTLQFIEDLLVAYHNAAHTNGGCIELRPLEPQRLRDRNRTNRRTWRTRLAGLAFGAVRGGRFLLRKPAALAVPTDGIEPVTSGPQFPAFDARQLDSSAFERVRESARRSGVAQNDLFLALLFETLVDWNRQHSADVGNRPIRVGIPVNLRTTEQQRTMPAANVVSVTYLDRTPRQTANRAELLAGISRQMNGIKRRRSGTFVKALRLLKRAKQLEKLARSERAFVTATFTNLGKILSRTGLPHDNGRCRVADAVLEDFEVQVPIRATMPAAFVVFTYAGRLNSCMSYDPWRMSAETARELHESFVGRITSS